MCDFEKYAFNKSELITRIDDVKSKIAELEGFGMDVSEALEKIEHARTIIQNDKVSVVLVGAFSDGKTSVVAGWLNEKMDNMKIDSDESSDEILCYTPCSIPEGCQIVDTPGLFGEKIGSDENGARIALSDKTKKYISEANLILYVVTAKNPIKDSHKECIRWILKDLNKLSTTIFVINRMDDVADMTDEEDYAMQARIKSDNLRSKLVDCGLTPDEIQKVKIACISAAPDGKGIEEWEGYREEYLRRSHLSALEAMTNDILQNTRQQLIVKTGCDILNDEINKMLLVIREQVRFIETILLPEEKETLERNKKDLDKLAKRLLRSRGEIRDELRVLEKSKIAAIRAATMEKFNEVMEDEIGIIPGQEGYRVNDEINAIFERYFSKCTEWTAQVGASIQCEYKKQDEMVQSMISKGSGIASVTLKSVGADGYKRIIFGSRDLLGKLGKTIKFKPWQVTKMANFATKAVPVAGLCIDLVSDAVAIYKEKKLNEEFKIAKKQLIEGLLTLFKEVNNGLNDNDKYFTDFVPDYGLLLAQIRNDEATIHMQEQQLKAFKAWTKQVSDADLMVC